MTIQEYFQATDEIISKQKEINDLKCRFVISRREVDLDEVEKIMRECNSAFRKKNDKRMCFVLIFILTYSATFDNKIPHSVRYLLSLYLKKHCTGISRDWREAKEKYREDESFRKKADVIFEKWNKEEA